MLNILKKTFTLDTRSIALFRVALGLLILAEVGYRLLDVEAHYTDFGVLPRYVLLQHHWWTYNFSLHLWANSIAEVSFLFFLQGLFALGLILGYRPKLMCILSWIWMVSLHNRNPLIIHGGDAEFRLLLFWAMFLPLTVPKKITQKTTSVFSMATVAYIFQICFIYWFTALHKAGPGWHTRYDAVYYALQLDQFATPFGIWLREQLLLCKALTFFTFYFELLGPFLFLIPFKQTWFRTIGVLGFVGMHLGFYLAMELGLFPFVSSIAMLPFIPTAVWTRLDKHLPKHFSQLLSGILIPYRTLALPKSFILIRTYALSFAALITLGYVFFYNLKDTRQFKMTVPRYVSYPGRFLKIAQKWSMFSTQSKDDGWYVIEGVTRSKQRVDVYHRKFASISWEKPALVSRGIYWHRWRKYLFTFTNRDNAKYRIYYGQYLCRSWNREHTQKSKQLDNLNIYFVQEWTKPPGEPMPIKTLLLLSHQCDLPKKLVAKNKTNFQRFLGYLFEGHDPSPQRLSRQTLEPT